MKTGIGKLLQIDTANRSMILALLVQAGCTGLFAGAMELAGNVMFLEHHDASQIPLAMMVSGAAGILLASIYTYFSKQLEIKPFGILNLVAAGVAVLAFFPASGLLAKSDFTFLVFVLTGPMLLVVLLGFRITVRSFLSPSKGKELGGLIEGALVGGMVFSFLLSPLLVRSGVGIQTILFVGLLCLSLAAGAQLFVLMAMGKKGEYPSRRVSSTGPIRLFSHRYTGLISAFAVLGVGVSVVLHYIFLWGSSDRYAGGGELVMFFGLFFAGMVALGWLLKRFVFGWLKKHYGVGITLLLLPALLILASLAAVITADLSGLGGASMASYFLVLMFVGRFLYGSGIYSLQDPSLNVIYQTLDPREKQNVKSGIEAILSQVGVFTMGLLLACLVLFPFMEVEYISIMLIVLLMAWFFVGLSLYRNYRKILKVSLESDRIRDQMYRGLSELAGMDLERTAFPVEVLEFDPYLFHYRPHSELLKLLEHAHPGVRIRIWDHLLATAPGLPQLTLSQMLGVEHEPDIRERIRALAQRKLRSKMGLQEAFIRERLDRFSDVSTQEDPAIGEAFQSGERNEVFAALYHVAREKDATYLPELVGLLREKDLDLRSVAISAAGQMDSRRLCAQLIESLEDPVLYARAWSALVNQGSMVLEELESAFHKPAADIRLQKRIISVIAAIGGEQAMQILVEKLDYHQREVFGAVLRGLYENHFQANELQGPKVESAIMKLVQAGAWNLGAKISMRMDNPGGQLHAAIDQEIWTVNERILILLSFIYDRRSVHRIHMNLLNRQTEDRGMAVELLDLLLNEPLKGVLISYFNDVLVREKIDHMQSVDRIELMPVDLLLRKILNRDGMQMGDFIRICVLERMGKVPRFFDEQQIIAQGFHPNPKIRETAAQILRKNDPGRFDMVTERLDFPDNSFPDHEDSASWYVDTTINLAAWKLFKDVGINSLFKLVSVLQPFSEEALSEGDKVVLARAKTVPVQSPLVSGMAMIAVEHPEILEQIRYLGSDSAREAYLVEREVFVELLFDDRSLLHAVADFLNLSGSRPV